MREFSTNSTAEPQAGSERKRRMEEKREKMQENKMGVLPVNRLLLSMSVPIMISMLVSALYNIVDSVYVSRVSEDALNAVSLAFPVQNLMIAVSTGTGVGINALLSKSLGEKNFERANRAASNGVFLAVCSYKTSLVCHQDQSFGLFIQITFERLLQSTGKTLYSMFTQTLGAIINIVLDPILIFTCGMGVTGAAVATVIGQIIAATVSVILNTKRNREITVAVRGFRPDGATIGRIYSVGIPSIIMASIGSVMTFGLNQILIAFNTTATAVLGIYFKLQSFIFMPIFGLNNGMVPIIAYNFGARKPDRMLKAIKLGAVYATIIMAVGFAIFQLASGFLLSVLFDASEAMLAIGVPALRTISISFLLAGACIICSSAFQALGHGLLSLISSVVRQLVVLLPAAWLLSLSGRLELVWWAFPLSELFSTTLTVMFLIYVYKKEIRPLYEVR